MTPRSLVPVLALTAALVLTACGGGGSSGSAPRPSIPSYTPPPDATPPVEMPADQLARASALLSRSDSFIMSDLLGETSDPDFPRVRLRASCTGETCTFRHPETGVTTRFSKDDLTFQSGVSEGILTRNGITLFVGASATATGWGAWMHHAAFEVQAARYQQDGIRIEGRAAAILGDRTRTRPATTATWHGVMVGTPATGSRAGNLLTGTAQLTYRPGPATLDATLTDIFDMTRAATHSVPRVRFTAVPVAPDGTYGAGASGNRIQGGLYGPRHAETAGVFEQSGIVGAFGAIRDTT